MITKKEIQHIAKLARLGLTEKEIEKFQGEFSRILDYIEKLKEVDTTKVESSRFILRRENVARKDEAQEGIKSETRRKLLKLAPETKDGYLKTKPILYPIRN